MGLERALVALNGLGSVYEVDTIAPLVDELRRMAAAPSEHELRVVSDHVRAACFAIADGVTPAHAKRGYVVRRLVRRCGVLARRLGLPAGWHAQAAAVLPRLLGDAYPEIARAQEAVVAVVGDELGKFERTLAQGLRMLERRKVLDGKVAFDLLQTYGFPLELTRELAAVSGARIDEEDFRVALEEHRVRSRASARASR
jgi:alanyl-tRNA synthetase